MRLPAPLHAVGLCRPARCRCAMAMFLGHRDCFQSALVDTLPGCQSKARLPWWTQGADMLAVLKPTQLPLAAARRLHNLASARPTPSLWRAPGTSVLCRERPTMRVFGWFHGSQCPLTTEEGCTCAKAQMACCSFCSGAADAASWQ